jgi:MFS family permease
MTGTSLEREERSAFRAAVDTGLWDIWLASVAAMFAIAPLLSGALGDFWSVAIFLPVWAALFVVIWLVRERVIVPRVGVVRWGEHRKIRLRRFTVVMLVVNVVALALGVVSAIVAPRGPGEQWAVPIAFSLVVLVGFSAAAWALNLPRLFLYAVLMGAGPLIGEWLFRQGHVSHHGFPVVFGALAGIIAAIGLIKLALIVRRNRPIGDETSLGRNDA